MRFFNSLAGGEPSWRGAAVVAARSLFLERFRQVLREDVLTAVVCAMQQCFPAWAGREQGCVEGGGGEEQSEGLMDVGSRGGGVGGGKLAALRPYSGPTEPWSAGTIQRLNKLPFVHSLPD